MIIGITLGDPGGIGPEIVFKSLKTVFNNKDISEKKCSDIYIIFGSKKVIDKYKLNSLFNALNIKIINSLEKKNLKKGCIYFMDLFEIEHSLVTGKPDKQNGQASYEYIKTAIKYALEKKIDSIVTAPICKASLALAGIPYTGHTTMLSDLTNSPETSMAFYTEKLKTVLVTIHKPFKEVPKLLTEKNLSKAVENSFIFAKQLGLKNPRIAIAGLNPHAGEDGLFGTEEQEQIIPVINKYIQKDQKVFGPFPADTIYHQAYNGEFDIVISLYHDQGLIPIKLLAFDKAVNITLGLPFLRTSPDHGTAFNITGKNQASPLSMINAIKYVLSTSENS
jgi:4-phospho-D-threonate 3-dehydrogenase / 4-phospho-D-erythronate 3-dehydrogenase